jgi:hypothetical protein
VRSIVHFSSVASLLGSPGQVNYAAANAGLDAAAGAAQPAGIPAVSVQWGAWAGGGMAAADAQTAARVERMGMSLISPAAGLAALESSVFGIACSIPSAPPTVAAVPFLWPQFVQRQLQRGVDISFFGEFSEGLIAAGQAAEAGPAAEQPAVSLDAVKAAVHSSVQEVLGSTVADDQPLMAAGLDSLGSVVSYLC